MSYRNVTLKRIQRLYNHLDKYGPINAVNLYDVSRPVGITGDELTRLLRIIRSPEWIADHGWTIPFVAKGTAPKVYSVEHTHGQTALLRDGNQRKSDEMETHMRRNLAGLQLEAQLATGTAKRKAEILSTTTEAALKLIDLGI